MREARGKARLNCRFLVPEKNCHTIDRLSQGKQSIGSGTLTLLQPVWLPFEVPRAANMAAKRIGTTAHGAVIPILLCAATEPAFSACGADVRSGPGRISLDLRQV